MQKNKHYILRTILVLFLLSFSSVGAKNLTLVLDPGHGGPRPGCVYTYNGKTIVERDLTLKIAKYLKNELQKYKTPKDEKVMVHLTRNNNTCPDLEQRILIAKNKKASALVSLHINASSNKDANGCMVLVTHSNYHNLYNKEHNMGKSIIKELNNAGVKTAKLYNTSAKNAGLLRKLSDDGSKYPNGDTTDWYGIVRHGVNHKIPSVLVEHAFLSNKSDYEKFLSSDEKLKKLAVADAKGIAKYYKLKPKADNKKEKAAKSNKSQKKQSKKKNQTTNKKTK